METRTLEGIPLSTMREAFNEAFSDYTIPFGFTDEAFAAKMTAENIRPEHSAGAFDKGKLVGFILNATDEINGEKLVFNAGTGVVPAYRGQRLTKKLYNYILPLLRDMGYRHHQLEVLAGNIKAEQIYKKTGFKTVRTVRAFTGTLTSPVTDTITLKPIDAAELDSLQQFWNVEPTWQNYTQCIRRAIGTHRIVGAFSGNNIVGYAAYDMVSGRIKQFAVKKEERRQGIGTALFYYVNKETGKISFTNYDQSDREGIAFFKALGLEPSYELYEMKLCY